jgi:hypothetical protein
MASERMGDQPRADRLMEIAGARSWRDTLGQAWLFGHELQQHDFAAAVTHADAMLRIDPELETQVFPALAAFSASPEGENALVQLLSTAPPWRGRFLQQLSSHITDDAALSRLFDRLQAGPRPPATADVVAFLGRLVVDGRYQQAAAYWRATLPPQQRAGLDKHPFNGDFALPIDNLPFNWVVRSVEGADIQVVEAPGTSGKALRVEFSGARVDFHNVVQLMLLPPGTYRLTGQVKAEELQSRRGLWWRVDCAESDDADDMLGHTALVTGTEPWTDFETTFTIPPTNCAAQWLQLEVPARIDPERDISGEVWYRALHIEPDSVAAQR